MEFHAERYLGNGIWVELDGFKISLYRKVPLVLITLPVTLKDPLVTSEIQNEFNNFIRYVSLLIFSKTEGNS
jgi:hypothetical protein